MKIKLTYMIPASNILMFPHLFSNCLGVTVDTDQVDTIDDFKAKIADEILRDYGICITRFDESAVHRWDDVSEAVLSAIQERFEHEWNDAFAEAEAFEKMRDKTVADMNKQVNAAYKKANKLHERWIKSLS